MKQYYVIGKNISYSLSPEIHAGICAAAGLEYRYSIKNLGEDEIEDFFFERNFDGLNVTVPYKKKAAALCDMLSETARRTGSVNTVKNMCGILYGTNTDVPGFRYASEKVGFDYKGKKVLVLGSGGASSAVTYVLTEAGAADIRIISRSGVFPDNYEGIDCHLDADYVINATPVGMNNYDPEKSPVSLKNFKNLSGVFDLIYSPPVTKLLAEADSLKIKNTNGLKMLVSQAVFAAEFFTGKNFGNDRDVITEKVEKMLPL